MKECNKGGKRNRWQGVPIRKGMVGSRLSASTGHVPVFHFLSAPNRSDLDFLEPWLDNMRDFLLALPSLSALKLTRRIHLLPVQKILNHQDHALRRLWLFQVTERSEQPNGPDERNFDTSGLIESLPRSCPLLEELAIPVRRSKGDRSEVDAYRSLRRCSSCVSWT